MVRLKLVETENDVKELVKKALKARGAWSYAPVQNGLGEHGIPDRIACVPLKITQEMVGATLGLFVGIEAKKPGRRGQKLAGCTGAQVDQLRGIAAAKGVALLVDGEDDVEILTKAIDGGLLPVIDWNAFLNERTRTNG